PHVSTSDRDCGRTRPYVDGRQQATGVWVNTSNMPGTAEGHPYRAGADSDRARRGANGRDSEAIAGERVEAADRPVAAVCHPDSPGACGDVDRVRPHLNLLDDLVGIRVDT